MARNQSQNRNNLVDPQARMAIDKMKYEIATEFGVWLGPYYVSPKRFCRWRNYQAFGVNG